MAFGVAGELQVRLLGSARVRAGARRVAFAPEKRFQLLAYLAYTGEAVRRERLAYLFWPDTDTTRAHQNLRQLLKRVRALDWVGDLVASGPLVRWDPATDVAAFRSALAEGRIDDALAWYDGPLLAGLETDDAPEFGAWLEYERARLHTLWREAVLRRAAELHAEPAAGARLLGALVADDPLDEEAVQAYLHAAASAGQRPQALGAYRTLVQTLDAEFGLEPARATRELAEAIAHAPDPGGSRPLPAVPPHAFAAASSFVGRELELAEIAHLLDDPGRRLVTLVGPGGIGKTRLALRAADELAERYPDGVHAVALEALADPAAVATAVAEALGVRLEGGEPPLAQLLRRLTRRRCLLVLDNFEHLLDATPFVSSLVRGCPGLTLLVTSRVRLELSEEWGVAVRGLPLGKDQPSSDAVALFVQRASQVAPGFAATETLLPSIVRICELVEGSPLGIELAAAWVRVLSPAEIAAAIASDSDLLATTARDVPDRHRSLQATFEHSWRLLTPAEQGVLRRLAVFQGGFTRDAAAAVAGAPVAVLAALHDKSLLRVRDGRFDRHPLLHQFTQEKLANDPVEAAEVRERHGRFFFALLAGAWAEGDPQRDRDLVGSDLENVRIALDWLVEFQPAELHRALPGVNEVLEVRGRYSESRSLFARIAERLDSGDPAQHATLATALAFQAWACLRLGRPREGAEFAERALAAASPTDAPVALGFARAALAAFAYETGDFAGARRLYEQLATQIRTAAAAGQLPSRRAAEALAANTANSADVAIALGDYEAARRLYREAIALHRETGHDPHLADTLNDYGFALQLSGRPAEALAYHREGLELARRVGMERVVPYALRDLAAAHLALDDPVAASDYAKEALRVAEEGELASGRHDALLVLGRVHARLGDPGEAETRLRQALAAAWSGQAYPKVLEALVHLALVWLDQGRSQAAAGLLRLAADHPATDHATRATAAEIVAASAAAAAPAESGADLATVVTALLRETW